MSWVLILVALFVGFILGLAVAFALRLMQAKTAKEIAEELLRENETQRKANIDAIIENIKASFGSLSLAALSTSTEEFLKLAQTTLAAEREVTTKELETKKGLIDQQLQHMTSELTTVSKLINELERDRVEKFGELAGQLKATSEQTANLMKTTNMLREALVSTKVRGQWGERMAEDILRIAGFIENVNYLKQQTIGEIGSRPDFTFLLPRNLKLNMDVKFPWDNYTQFLAANTESDKINFRNKFLRDVKAKIKEVTTREYINPEQNTVDYVLLLIPSEQIYAFIHEQDSTILDEGLKNKVVLCSPITLFAVLAVIRQAVDNFALEQTSSEILSLLSRFRKEWDEFCNKLELLGKRIGQVQKDYEILTTTRLRQLEKPLNKIESLRRERGLSVAPEENGVSPVPEVNPGTNDNITPGE
ncbi:DNA recombination protein RmuC [Candidatus Acetothermia bacterium]|jgi:DNA recombination protein RmuC|nr:DNA recombination protein RmuC [Candidatus Acetothermia bacterium]MCI2426211.1 DNA recombination protein RmuC [Candidatus Acetothermia bacterium]MCI2427052.1 DNA recombination protein RmuC [Candidatus Acetothermia bacterium]MCI2428920.1 DNA recombination protein RmuC [Candidatus Acetothermia bacterium]